jgi:predicted NAD-dependent protein-ADP-ribosyltransferase YbiA (DUF1768 family)
MSGEEESKIDLESLGEGKEEEEQLPQEEGEEEEGEGNNENENENEEEGEEEAAEEEAPAAGAGGALAALTAALTGAKKPKQKPDEILKAPKEKSKKPRALPKIKDSASFFRARRKYPKNFTFSETGDLIKINLEGTQETSITLPYYAPTTANEKAEAEQKRKDELLLIEKEYDDTLELLKEALVTWRTTRAASDVLYLQVKLKELDARRSLLQHGAKWMISADNLETKQIILDKKKDHKKIPYSVSLLRIRPNRFDELVKVVDGPPEVVKEDEDEDEEVSLSGGESGAEEEETIFGFFGPDDPDLGFLSPDTKTTFVFNKTQYNSPSQAFVVERLRQLGREQKFLDNLLKMGDPRKVRLFGKSAQVQGELKDPLGLWTEILKTLIAQHPDIGDLLRYTENFTLVYADPTEKVWGIGLPVDSQDIHNKEAWQGQNLLGKAWMSVRKLLPPAAVSGEQKGGAMIAKSDIEKHAMTKERFAAKRAKILQHMYKYKPTN